MDLTGGPWDEAGRTTTEGGEGGLSGSCEVELEELESVWRRTVFFWKVSSRAEAAVDVVMPDSLET